jgi:hypothetical protein
MRLVYSHSIQHLGYWSKQKSYNKYFETLFFRNTHDFFFCGGVLARPTHGLAPKGKKAKVKSNKPEKYQPRVDMWGAISYSKPLAFDIKTSEDRKKEGVKGYRKKHLETFLRKKLAPKISTMQSKVILNIAEDFTANQQSCWMN